MPGNELVTLRIMILYFYVYVYNCCYFFTKMNINMVNTCVNDEILLK